MLRLSKQSSTICAVWTEAPSCLKWKSPSGNCVSRKLHPKETASKGNCASKFLCAIILLQRALRLVASAWFRGLRRLYRRSFVIVAADRRGDGGEGSVIGVATRALLRAVSGRALLVGVLRAAGGWLFERSRQTC